MFCLIDDLIDVSAVLDALDYDGTDAFADRLLRWKAIDNNGMHSRLEVNVQDTWQRLVLLEDVVLNDLSDSSFLITESVV